MSLDKKKVMGQDSDSGETFKERLNRLNNNLGLCRKYKEETARYVKRLEEQYKKGIFSYTAYEYLLNKYLKGCSLEYWTRHYEDQEKKIGEKLKALKLHRQKFAFKKQAPIETRSETKHGNNFLSYCLAVLVLALGLIFLYGQVFDAPFGNLITGLSVSESNESLNNVPVIVSYTPENDLSLELGESQAFTVIASDADEDELSIGWYVNILPTGQTSDSFTFTPTEHGEFEIKVLIHDSKDYTSHKWLLTVTAKEESAQEIVDETLPGETYEILPEEVNVTTPEENKTEEETIVNDSEENIEIPEIDETIIDNFTEETPVGENITNPEAVTIPENVTQPAETTEINAQVTSMEQLHAEINKPVQWIVRAETNETYLVIELPAQATAISVDRIIQVPTIKTRTVKEPVLKENITIKIGSEALSLSTYELTGQSVTGFFITNTKNKGILSTITDWTSFKFLFYKTLMSISKAVSNIFSITAGNFLTTFATTEVETTGKIILVIEDEAEEFEISYSTPAPRTREKEEADGKLVTVYSDMNYTDVLTYTSIKKGKKVSNVAWLTNDTEENMTYQLHDENSDGMIDKASWITPHLSEQTFNIILSNEPGYTEQPDSFDAYIPANEMYYITNCPKDNCESPNISRLEENPDDFYAVINLAVNGPADDFGAQMSFDLSNKPEQFSQAFICSYATTMMLAEPVINYIEILNDETKTLTLEGIEQGWLQGIVNQVPGWRCIEITDQLKQQNDNRLAVRWWGHDDKRNRPLQYVRFLAQSQLQYCEGHNPSNASDCRPYLGIKL